MTVPIWTQVFRNGLLPLIGEIELDTLKDLLERDDPRLIQGVTTTPPPLMCVQDWPVEAACLLGMCGWVGLTEGDLSETTVGEVEERFTRLCFGIDQAIGVPGGCRHLLNWYDETPRDEMRRDLLVEVELALNKE